MSQHVANSGVQAQVIGRAIELALRELVRVEILGGLCGGDWSSSGPRPPRVGVDVCVPWFLLIRNSQGPGSGRLAAALRASSHSEAGKMPITKTPAAQIASARRSAGARGGGGSGSTGSRM